MNISQLAHIEKNKFTIIDIAPENNTTISIATIQSDELQDYPIEDYIKRESNAWKVSEQRIFTQIGEFIAYYPSFVEIPENGTDVSARTIPFVYRDGEEAFGFLDRVWLIPLVQGKPAVIHDEKFSLLLKVMANCIDESRQGIDNGLAYNPLPVAYMRIPKENLGHGTVSPMAGEALGAVVPYSETLKRLMCKMVILTSLYHDGVFDGMLDVPMRKMVFLDEARRTVSREDLQSVYCAIRGVVFCIHCLFARLVSANVGGKADFSQLMNFGTAIAALDYGIDAEETKILKENGIEVADLADAYEQYSCIMQGYIDFFVDDETEIIVGDTAVQDVDKTREIVDHIHGMMMPLISFDKRTQDLFLVSESFLSDVRPDKRNSVV